MKTNNVLRMNLGCGSTVSWLKFHDKNRQNVKMRTKNTQTLTKHAYKLPQTLQLHFDILSCCERTTSTYKPFTVSYHLLKVDREDRLFV